MGIDSPPDLGAQIMEERMAWAIRMVQERCKDANLPFSEPMMVKAIEVGISLYIQKEQRTMKGLK